MISSLFEYGTEGPPEVTFRAHSVFVGVVAGLRAAQTQTLHHIYTWHRINVSRWLRRLPVANCVDPLPAGLLRSDNEVALQILGGTAEIDGVLVTDASPQNDIELKTGATYMFIATACDNRTALLPHGGLDAFGVEGEAIRPLVYGGPVGFVSKVVEAGTVSRLAEYLRTIER
jgi:hypothetical protein